MRRAIIVSGRTVPVRIAMSMPSRAMSARRSLTSSSTRSAGCLSFRPARLGSSRYCAITVLAATRTSPVGSRACSANSPCSASSVPVRRWQ